MAWLCGFRRRFSNVVHPRAGLLGLAPGDVGDRGGAKSRAESLHPLLPDPAGLLALLSHHTIEGLHDLEDVDLIRRTRQRVAALGPTMADQDPGATQRREELLEELHGDPAPLGHLADRNRGIAGACQLR